MRSVLFAAVLTSSTMMVGIHWTPGTRYTIATVGGHCLGWKRETCYEADLARQLRVKQYVTPLLLARINVLNRLFHGSGA